tara:strand:+ start:2481 stop:2912 length:432 start_codon:yes stop_codon:yes gene_type:complete
MPVKYLDEVIVEAIAKWDNTRNVDKMSQKYQINLTQLDKETVKKLKEIGINVRNNSKDEDDKEFIVPRNGMYPPDVVDNDGNPIPPEQRIGNGSKVRALLTPYAYDNSTGSGVACGINSIRVMELVDSGARGGVSKLFADEPF